MESSKLAMTGRVVVIAASLMGAWSSAELLTLQDGGWAISGPTGGLLSYLCGEKPTPATGCGAVLASRYGSFDFFWGERRVVVPTSYLGFVYYIAWIVGLVSLGFPRPGDRWAWRILVAVVTAGAACSLWLGGQMAFLLRSWCPLCSLVHLANLILLVTIITIHKRHRTLSADRNDTARVESGRVQVGKAGQIDVHPSHGFGAGLAVRSSFASPSASSLHRRLALLTSLAVVGIALGTWWYYEAVLTARSEWRRHASYRSLIESLQADPDFMLREYYAQPILSPLADRQVPDAGGSDHSSDHPVPRLVMFLTRDHKSSACFLKSWNADLRGQFGFELEPEAYDLSRCVTRLSLGDARNSIHEPPGGQLRSCRPIAEAADCSRDARVTELARALGVDAAPAVFLDGRRVPDLCLMSRTFWRAMGHELRGRKSVVSAR